MLALWILSVLRINNHCFHYKFPQSDAAILQDNLIQEWKWVLLVLELEMHYYLEIQR